MEHALWSQGSCLRCVKPSTNWINRKCGGSFSFLLHGWDFLEAFFPFFVGGLLSFFFSAVVSDAVLREENPCPGSRFCLWTAALGEVCLFCCLSCLVACLNEPAFFRDWLHDSLIDTELSAFVLHFGMTQFCLWKFITWICACVTFCIDYAD